MAEYLLDIQGLKLSFSSEEGKTEVLDDITLQISNGDVMGLLGESGSGKSVTGLSVMGLLPKTARIEAGSMYFQGRSVMDLSPNEYKHLRGGQVGMVFQSPGATLNPLIRIGKQIDEVLELHRSIRGKAARDESLHLIDRVNLPPRVYRQYPHELSGGMQQRAAIAIAIACHPDLLILDEPTSALDVTVQSEILFLLNSLRTEGLVKSILFITHDVGVMYEICNYVSIMYAGQIMESGPVKDVLSNPVHPYTCGLIGAVPKMNNHDRLRYIMGTVPNLMEPLSGCRFQTRCEQYTQKCKERPSVTLRGDYHRIWCHLAREGA